jgi:hypothetical protein
MRADNGVAVDEILIIIVINSNPGIPYRMIDPPFGGRIDGLTVNGKWKKKCGKQVDNKINIKIPDSLLFNQTNISIFIRKTNC